MNELIDGGSSKVGARVRVTDESVPEPTDSQRELIKTLLSTVAQAVVSALRSKNPEGDLQDLIEKVSVKKL